MSKTSDILNSIDAILTGASNQGLIHRTAENEAFVGSNIRLDGADLVNFGSCSYLGLETDLRLKEGAIRAVEKYGTQLSCSRAYISAPPYLEAEELISQAFGRPSHMATTCLLGDLSALPVLIDGADAVIFDQQVHNTVQTALHQVRAQGTHIELLRHNAWQELEERVGELAKKYRKVWYLADGVYSMYGDVAPFGELRRILERFEQLHIYFDDAHGGSWFGKHGRGTALEEFVDHERVYTVMSFAKSFGCGGAALTFPNRELLRRVKTVGGPMIFCGPVQPPVLGALIASMKIHLSSEILELQQKLQQRISYFNQLSEQHCLPLIDTGIVPIRFFGMGPHTVTYKMIRRLMADGYYTNFASFPAVPMKRSGVRLTITNHQSMESIRGLVESIARHLPSALAEEGSSIDELWSEFKFRGPKPGASSRVERESLVLELTRPKVLSLETATSIEQVDRREWDSLLGARGSFSWEGMKFLEDAFQGNPEKENNWGFHYYIVRDGNRKPVLATFFTESLWKDDLLAPEDVSRRIEEKRKTDPYFLTSLNLTMGSQLTEGEHLYLDRSGDWRAAMELLLKEVSRRRTLIGANNLILRDLPSGDPEMDDFLLDQGFSKFDMPEASTIRVAWKSEEEYLTQLPLKSRKHVRREVLRHDTEFKIELIRSGERELSEAELDHLYRLYLNIKERSLKLNTFNLPRSVFSKALKHPGWELLLFYLPEQEKMPVGFSVCYGGGPQYVLLFLGLDYRYVTSHGVYRQALMAGVRRATALDSKVIYAGFDAAFEKKRFGSEAHVPCMYAQSADHYQAELLGQFMAQANLEGPRATH